jgi:hypothetical protein
MTFLLLFLLYSFSSYRQVYGWKLDPSCTQMGVADDIRNAMAGAFDMVNSARVRLSASPWAADTTELIGHLFAKEGQNPNELDMYKTRSVFDSIEHDYKTELTADQVPDRRNIVSTVLLAYLCPLSDEISCLRLCFVLLIALRRLRADSTYIEIKV